MPVTGTTRIALIIAVTLALATVLVVARRSPPAIPELSTVQTEVALGSQLRDTLADGSPGPVMIVVAAGRFLMGGAPGTTDFDTERPRHEVAIPMPIAVARTETTVSEFRQFIADSGHSIEPGCWYHDTDQEWREDESASWEAPGYAQADDHPVTCINWPDANAYADWLSERTGRRYRLPSEAEFEYFNRAGLDGDYGFDVAGQEQLCQVMNGADLASGQPYANPCDDGFDGTSPVGNFPANAFGLFDTGGNLWEFTADCWNEDYDGGWLTLFTGAPVDGSAWTRGDCRLHVIRGGSFLSSPNNLRAARRDHDGGRLRVNRTGLRMVRDL